MSEPERDDETLRLDDALKMAGIAATGGAAKMMIQSGEVKVNGVVETRRKRKLEEGDVIEVGDESFEIAMADDEEDEDEDDAAFAALHADAERLAPDETRAWALWIEERVADDDLDAVLIRLGGLHPEALEAVFALLPEEVEERVLDALDEVLERVAAEDLDGGDSPMQA
jgi:ribosome-associated protein